MGISHCTGKLTDQKRKSVQVSLQLSQGTILEKLNYFRSPIFFGVLHQQVTGYERLIQNALTLLNLHRISEMQAMIELIISEIDFLMPQWNQTLLLLEDLIFIFKMYKKLYFEQIKVMYRLPNEKKLELIKVVRVIEIFQNECLQLGIELVIITTHSTVLEKSKRWFFNRKYYEIRFDTISEAFLELGKNNIVSMGTEIQQLKNALNTQYLVSIGQMIKAMSSLYLSYSFFVDNSIPLSTSIINRPHCSILNNDPISLNNQVICESQRDIIKVDGIPGSLKEE